MTQKIIDNIAQILTVLRIVDTGDINRTFQIHSNKLSLYYKKITGCKVTVIIQKFIVLSLPVILYPAC